LAVVQLGSCGGCQLSLLDLGERFLEIMESYSMEYFLMIKEADAPPEVDIALVEGTVRHARHLAMARMTRERANLLVALGTCSVFGGVQGLCNAHGEGRWEESLSRAGAGEDIPMFTRRVMPLDAYVSVDFRLPGCPVPAELLWSFLQQVGEGGRPARETATVCAECPRTGRGEGGGPHRFIEEDSRPGTCFLEQGYLCLGPLTRDGCASRCPGSWDYPCRGCRGPSDGALAFQQLDPLRESLRRLSRSTGEKEEKVVELFMDAPQAFFMFSLAEPTFRGRRRGGTSGLVFRI